MDRGPHAWLAQQLGLERLQNAHVALPDDDSFPEPYEGTADDARRLMERIGSFMQIDAAEDRSSWKFVTTRPCPGGAANMTGADPPGRESTGRSTETGRPIGPQVSGQVIL